MWRVSLSRYAILINDLQYDLVNKSEERKAAVDAFIPSMIGFLGRARSLGVHVVHLQLINELDDPRAERYDGWLPCTQGSDGARLLEDVVDPRDLIVEKNKDSGFFDTDLHERLKERGVDTVVVTGMQTQICVQTTAADAFFRGYNVIVPPDGVVSARPEDKTRALEWLRSYCATIMGIEQFLRAVEADEIPEFEVVSIP
ncbi:MAG: cysteine hydrolase family protein [Thermoleophilia bacterium]